MNHAQSIDRQRGATLIVSLIMLTLITVLVTSAFTMSNTSLLSIGATQSRDEAIAAANKAIEQVLSSPFTIAPAEDLINVDIDNDDLNDYEVAVAAPACVNAVRIAAASTPPSSLSLGGTFGALASDYYQTVWEIDASVVQSNGAGAAVRVRQGVRVLLNQTQYEAVCSS